MRTLILPRVGSMGDTSTMTLSPGMTRTTVCFGMPVSATVLVFPSSHFARYKPWGSALSTTPFRSVPITTASTTKSHRGADPLLDLVERTDAAHSLHYA